MTTVDAQTQPRRSGASHVRHRALFPTSRSDLRVTWHGDDDAFVVSLWRDSTCVGSAPLSPPEAARLAAHIVAELGDRSVWGPRLVSPPAPAEAAGATVGRVAAALGRRLGLMRPGPKG